jgi:5'-3' exoribonuclease 1
LKGLLGIGGAAPAPPAPKAPPAPASAPKSLAEIEALAGVAPVPSAGGDDEDPLAFWKSLQAQHRSEADKLTGTEGGESGGAGRRRRKK